MEIFKTLATSTLNGAIDASQTTLVVTSASLFPASGEFMILIDNELMEVTGVAGTTFTVVRARESTTGASHANGATVGEVLTYDAIQDYRSDNADYATYANLVSRNAATPRDGRLGLTSDTPYSGLDIGVSGLLNHGYLYEMEPPVLADFSWRNQSTANADGDNLGIFLWAPGNASSTQISGLEITPPSPPYNVYAYLIGNRHHVDFLMFGVYMAENGTGKISSMHSVSSAGLRWEFNWWNAANSFNQVRVQVITGHWADQYNWFRMEHTGSLLNFYMSPDGYIWRKFAIDNPNSFFTTGPDRVGFFIQLGQPGTQYFQDVHCLHWKVVT